MAESPLSPSFNAMDLHSNSTDSTLRQNANSSSADSSTQSVGAGGNDGGAVNLQFPAPPVTAHIQIKLPLLSSSSSNSEGEGEGDGSGEAAATDANADGNGEPGGRAASPPPNCAICLGRCKNKCYTDSCRHQFCFKCLCEWSKVKPECPLCKQSFKSIIHNVKSEDQYEQYHIQQPTVQIPHRPFEMSMRLPRMFGEDFTLPNWDSPNIMSRVGRSFFYRGDGPANYRHNVELEAVNQALDNNRRVGNQNMFRGELLELYRQEFPEAIVSSAALSSLWRRYVYDRNLYALPVCDITGHFREVSARFYRDNPAQIHRLMPWINRDVLCLLRNNQTEDVSTVMTLIRDNLPIMNILSPAFRRCIAPWLGQKTAHFIHELYNFARSPYDMVGYDRAVHYSAVNEETIEFSSASSNEDNAAGTSRSNATASSTTTNAANVATGLAMIGIADTTVVTATSTITSQSPSSSTSRRHRHRRHHTAGGSGASGNALDSRLFDHGTSSTAVAETTTSSVGGGQSVTFSIDTTPEGLEVPGISVSSSTSGGGSRVGSQAQAINLSTHNRTGPLVIDSDDEVFQAANLLRNNSMWNRDPPTREARQSARLAAHWNVTANIELSTSSSDECEFVMERRAPHLRTPEEMVSLNSDSDSDVVFVTEIKSNLKKSSFKTSDEEDDNEDGDEQEQEHQRQRDNVPSTSTRRAAPRPRLENIEEYMDRVGPSTSSGVRSSARNTARTERQLRDRRLLRSSGAGGGEYNFGDTSSSNNGSGSEYECSTRSSKAAKQAKRNKRKSSRKSRSGTRSSRRSGGGGKHSKRSHANMEEGNEGSSNERRSKRKRRKVIKPASDHHNDDETDEGAEDGIRLDVLQARLKGGSGPNDERSNITKSYLEQAAQNVPNIPSETESGDSSESASESDSDSAIQKARELHRRLRGYNGSPMKVKDELVEEDSQEANTADDDDGGTVVPDGKHIVGDEEEDNAGEEANANSGESEEESSEDDDEDNDNVRDAANRPAAIDMNAHSEQSNSDSQNSHAEEEIQVEAADTTEQNDHQSDNEEHPAADDGEEQQWTDCSSDSDTSNERRKTPTELRKIPKIIIKEIKRSDSAQSFTSSSASSHSTATTVTSKANSRASPTNECASPVTELAGEVSRTSPTPSNAASVSDSASSSSSSTGSSNSNSNSNSDTSSYTSGSATSSRNPSPNTTALENNEQQQNQFHVEAEEGGDHSFDVSQDAGDVIVDGIVDAPITDDNQNEDDSMSTSGNEPYDAAHPQDDNTNNAAIDLPTSFSEVGEGSASGWSDMNL